MALTVERSVAVCGAELVRLAGNLTLGRDAQSFEWVIEELIKGGQTRIVVDLTEVPYVDSAGIGILIGCHGKVTGAGGQFRLAGTTERVLRVFQITRVDSILVLHPTVAAALATIV